MIKINEENAQNTRAGGRAPRRRPPLRSFTKRPPLLKPPTGILQAASRRPRHADRVTQTASRRPHSSDKDDIDYFGLRLIVHVLSRASPGKDDNPASLENSRAKQHYPISNRHRITLMQLNLDKSAESTIITSVRESGSTFEIRIGERIYSSSLILSPAGVTSWGASTLEGLGEEDYLALSELETEVIILGTGKTIRFPDPSLTRSLVEKQKGLEVMDTAAACRTYNILLADGRSVSAALIVES